MQVECSDSACAAAVQAHWQPAARGRMQVECTIFCTVNEPFPRSYFVATGIHTSMSDFRDGHGVNIISVGGTAVSSGGLPIATTTIGGVAVTAAAQLADNVAAPTAGYVGAVGYCLNTTGGFDRQTSVKSATAPTQTGIQAIGIVLDNGTNFRNASAAAGIGDGVNGQAVLCVQDYQYNGATYDRRYGNQNVTLLASAARTTNTTSSDQTNYNGRGVVVTLDCTASSSGSVTITIQGKDSVSGNYYTILAGTAVTTTSTNVYRVFPGLTASPNAVANDVLPRTWRISVAANNGNNITYSVGASVIV